MGGFNITKNLKLVKYFTSEFYLNHTNDLSHVASPTFEFSVNSGPVKGFEEYAERRAVFNHNAKLVFGKFRSDDDVHFYTEFETQLLNGTEVLGTCMFEVSELLIERVEIIYNLTDKEFAELERILLKNS